jgi:hypothetical protein
MALGCQVLSIENKIIYGRFVSKKDFSEKKFFLETL